MRRGAGVESCWLVGLVHISCSWHYLSHTPFRSGSQVRQSVEEKKSRKSTYAKKWKKSIFASYKILSISTTRNDLDPQFKQSTLEWGALLSYINYAKICSLLGDPRHQFQTTIFGGSPKILNPLHFFEDMDLRPVKRSWDPKWYILLRYTLVCAYQVSTLGSAWLRRSVDFWDKKFGTDALDLPRGSKFLHKLCMITVHLTHELIV